MREKERVGEREVGNKGAVRHRESEGRNGRATSGRETVARRL